MADTARGPRPDRRDARLAAWAFTIFPPLDLLVIVGGLAMTALVFFALGGFGFCTQRAATIVPMALVPETPGTCET